MIKQSINREYPIRSLKKYELEVLNSGHCKAFLTPGFTVDKEKVTVTTYHEGYICADRIEFADIIQVLNMIMRVTDALIDAADHLIPADRFSFELSSVFYSPGTDDVKIEYSLSEGNENDIDNILEEIMNRYRGREAEYLIELKRYINRNGPGLTDIKKHIISLKRQVFTDRRQSS